jgi:hypothetical protein
MNQQSIMWSKEKREEESRSAAALLTTRRFAGAVLSPIDIYTVKTLPPKALKGL